MINPLIGVDFIPLIDYKKESIDYGNSERICEKFYADRLSQVKAMLQIDSPFKPTAQSSFIYLTGLTGVGKTHFINQYWKQEHPAIHYDLSSLEAFCTDKSEGIITLFIDEANLAETEFSLFEGLFEPAPLFVSIMTFIM